MLKLEGGFTVCQGYSALQNYLISYFQSLPPKGAIISPIYSWENWGTTGYVTCLLMLYRETLVSGPEPRNSGSDFYVHTLLCPMVRWVYPLHLFPVILCLRLELDEHQALGTAWPLASGPAVQCWGRSTTRVWFFSFSPSFDCPYSHFYISSPVSFSSPEHLLL